MIALESQLVRKWSSVVRAQKAHMRALTMLYKGGEVPSFLNDKGHKESNKFSSAVKGKVKLLIFATTLENNTQAT